VTGYETACRATIINGKARHDNTSIETFQMLSGLIYGIWMIATSGELQS